MNFQGGSKKKMENSRWITVNLTENPGGVNIKKNRCPQQGVQFFSGKAKKAKSQFDLKKINQCLDIKGNTIEELAKKRKSTKMEKRSDDETHFLLIPSTIMKIKDVDNPIQTIVELVDDDMEIAFALLYKNPHHCTKNTGPRKLHNETVVLHHPTTTTIPVENDDLSKCLCCQ